VSSGNSGRSTVDVCVDGIARAHAEGFTRVWTAQQPSEPDLMSMLAVAFREVHDIEIGTAVLPIQVAHPMMTAQRVLAPQLISRGRHR
jgi:alkanesulfonate monooxygenase SsuD/methylene tetrahydromethanopterin reductase-like flavin-dependent oxidoreductase (luciferase family)